MRTISVDQDPILIVTIKSVASYMVSRLNHDHLFIQLRSNSFRKYRPGEPSSNY